MTEETILSELNADLRNVVLEAKKLSELTFKVVEGKRNKERSNFLWYKGEDDTIQIARNLGCAVTVLAEIDNIPCFNKEVYLEIADAFRYAGQNLKVNISWGGAKTKEGLINLTDEVDNLMSDIYEKCYENLLRNNEEINPFLQYFEIYYEK